MSMTEILLGLIITIIVAAGIAFVFTNARDKNNQQKTMNNLLFIRANIEQLFNNGDFTGLDNANLLLANIVPTELQKGGQIFSPWGPITFAEADGGANYTITVENLNTSACQALATLSPTSWQSIDVNGTVLYDRSVNDPINNIELIQACSGAGSGNVNTIVYTAP